MVLDNEFTSPSFGAGKSGRNDASRPIRFGALSRPPTTCSANHRSPSHSFGVVQGMRSPKWGQRSEAFGEAAELLASSDTSPKNADLLRLGIIQWKGAGVQRVKLPPANWFAPPGRNRSGSGGNVTCAGSVFKLNVPPACDRYRFPSIGVQFRTCWRLAEPSG
jgi:hypothetical protein